MELLTRYRISLSVFIAGLVVSGVTAFPLQLELHWLAATFGVDDVSQYASETGVRYWLAFVAHGLDQTYAAYPFVGYGTDWLAFGHLVIALFFIGPWRDPVGNNWVLYCGMAACVGIIPLALIAGSVREIPMGWRLVDCAFGVVGLLPLLYCHYVAKQLAAASPTERNDLATSA